MAALLVAALTFPVAAQQAKPAAKKPATKKSTAAAPAPAPVPTELKFDKTLGSAKAPITIEVYTDFECPACGALYLRTIRRVIQEYVWSNKVHLVHHDYPLPMHKYSRDAARWAVAASTFGKYEAVADALFENQSILTATGTVEALASKALSADEVKKIKLILEKQGSQVDANIEGDIFKAKTSQVTQTPTMFVRHKDKTYPVVGVVQFQVFKATLDDLLRK